VFVAVTNGMSEHRMAEGDGREQPRRREILQYFRVCTPAHARRLRDMAWLPLFDGILLDAHHTFRREWPAVAGTPWKDALFLLPLWKTHREFTVEVDGEDVSFLWHIPISDAEWGVPPGARGGRADRPYAGDRVAVAVRRERSGVAGGMSRNRGGRSSLLRTPPPKFVPDGMDFACHGPPAGGIRQGLAASLHRHVSVVRPRGVSCSACFRLPSF
jgi:hypothetical protein